MRDTCIPYMPWSKISYPAGRSPQLAVAKAGLFKGNANTASDRNCNVTLEKIDCDWLDFPLFSAVNML